MMAIHTTRPSWLTRRWITISLATLIWIFEPTDGVTSAPAVACQPGVSNSNCSSQCHCLVPSACGYYPGYNGISCSDYQCDRGWTGPPECQTACDSNHWDAGCSGVCYCLLPNTCDSVNGFCSSGCDTTHGGTACQIQMPQLSSSPQVSNISCSKLYVSWPAWSKTTGTGSGYVNTPLNVTSYSIEQRVNNSATGNSSWDFVQSVTSVFPQPTEYTQEVAVANMYNYFEYRIICNWDDAGKSRPGLPSSASLVTRPATACTVSTVTSPQPSTSAISFSPQQTTTISTTTTRATTTTVVATTTRQPDTTSPTPPTTTSTPSTTTVTPSTTTSTPTTTSPSTTTPSTTYPLIQSTSTLSPSTSTESLSTRWSTARQDFSTVPAIQLPPAPTGVTAVNITSNSISIIWEAPFTFVGHVIQYSVIYSLQAVSSYIYINGSLTSCVITGLFPATNYVIQVQAQSEASTDGGWGNRSLPVTIRTADGLPTAPTGLQVTNRSMTCINIKWASPLTTNGNITKYQVSYAANSSPNPSSGQQNVASSVYETVLCNLTAGVQYNIAVMASTSQGWGPPVSLNAWTEICAPPSPPRPVVNATGMQTISVIIQPAVLQCGPVSGYFIAVSVTSVNSTAGSRRRRSSSLPNPAQFIPLLATTVAQLAATDVTQTISFVIGDGSVYNGYQNAPLDSNNYYTIYYVVASSLDGVTKMAYSESISPVRPVAFGAGSSTVEAVPPTTVLAITTTYPVAAAGLSDAEKIGIGVGVGLGVLLLLALLLLFFCCWWKKRKQHTPGEGKLNTSWLQYYTNNFGYSNSKWTTIAAIDEPRFVKIDDELPVDLQVTDMHHSRPVISFSDEFKLLPVGMTFPCTVAQRPENTELNRFPHLLAYDHSRVVLGSANTYVNANYLQGYDRRRKAYIAAQSPFNQQTICDFWLLVYQERVAQIVLLAQLVEDSIVKCEQYWFDDYIPHKFGELTVTLIKVMPYANFIVRTFELSREGSTGDTRIVSQYHFMAWPEHGVPGDPLTLLEFHMKVRSRISNSVSSDNCPLLVHCGTGVSRTGVFIAVDYSLMRAKEENCVNVYRCCSAMRQCRPMMVRTLKQYTFIYDVLFEALLTHHAIVGEDINVNYRMLNRVNPQTNHSYFHEQFKVLEKFTELPSVEACAIGISDVNKNKNRFTTLRLLSRDQDRPILTGPLVNNNYINAVYMDSYTQRKAFIVTQTPLKNTLDEFLALLYEFNVCCVVSLNGSDYQEDTCVNYWPLQDGQTLHTRSGFNVTLRQTTQVDHVTVRKLELTNDTAQLHKVTQLQFQSWKMYDQAPWSREGFIKLLEAAQQVVRNGSNNSQNARVLPPIVIHCVDGSSQSGLFCAVWNICEKMKLEREVDMFHTIKAIKLKRFHCINSLVQYKFCFKLLWDYINTSLRPSQ